MTDAAAAEKVVYPFNKDNGMIYRRLGRTGLKVSAFSFGTWVTFGIQIDQDVADACIFRAIELGINYLDSAESYGAGAAETSLGISLQRAYAKYNIKRKDLVVSTKILKCGDGPNDVGLSHKRIMEGLDASLARLQMAYVDVVFAHRPDPTTPLEETVRAFTLAIRQGKAFYWGTSEWPADMITEAVGIAKRLNLIAPVVEQPQYNMFARQKIEQSYTRLYQTTGLGTTIWSPLASGLLTGKYNDGIPEGSRMAREDMAFLKFGLTEAKIEKVKKLAVVAEKLETTMAKLAVAWCLKAPGVSTVILGASKVSQLDENVKALALLPKLTTAVMAEIDEILDNKPTVTWAYQQHNGVYNFAMPYNAAEMQLQTEAWNNSPKL